MKHATFLIALALAACSQNAVTDETEATGPTGTETASTPEATPAPAPDPYEGWSVVEFWSGEWPDGFVIMTDGVVLPARAAMDPTSPTDIDCPLSKGANYHPWNGARIESDGLVFMTASEPLELSVTQDFSVTTAFAEDDKTLTARAGDTLVYKYYLAEGFFVAGHNGEEYELNEGEIAEFVAFPEANADDDEWVQVKCADEAGTRAWLRFEDVIAFDGVEMPELTEYGVATDAELD